MVTETEYISEIEYTKYTPYLALTGELCGVFDEEFWDDWARYNDTALYHAVFSPLNYHINTYTS